MFTTSRYASRETRLLARRMAEEGRERYVARGKHTIASLAALCRKAGDAKLCVVEEKGGKPRTVATIRIKETGEWEWASESAVK